MDKKGGTTWTISEPEIEITYYNNLNLNLNEILYKHNEITRKVGLRDVGGKDLLLWENVSLPTGLIIFLIKLNLKQFQIA